MQILFFDFEKKLFKVIEKTAFFLKNFQFIFFNPFLVMKRFIILKLFLVMPIFAVLAQDKLKVNVFTNKISQTQIQIIAENPFPCETSVLLDFEVENVCGTNDKMTILKPNAKKQILCTISPCKANQKWRYSYNFKYYVGNVLNKTYDQDFVYDLPYSKGESYKIMQGYFGDFSHQEQHAIDFDMPVGTKICAMRDGVVINVKENSNIGGNDRKFMKDGNHLWIMHTDGSIANYVHFRQNGVAVNVGDQVKKGQLVGYSGNTGFSSSPHLHIDIGMPTTGKRKSFATNFKLPNGKIGQLKKGDNFKKD